MIVQCTKDDLIQLVDKTRKKEVAYLKIEKSGESLLMDYTLVKDIKDASAQKKAERCLNNSIRIIFDLINQLNKLISVLTDEIKPLRYDLLFDATNNAKATCSFNSMFPNGVFVTKSNKVVNIDWDTVFTDKLDEEIPDLFIRKSAKKYQLATYRDLVNILKH